MLAEQRRQRILYEVQTRGAVQVHELACLLEVSSMTVRRDLRDLDEQGLLTRVHGGAESSGSGVEPTFSEKAALHADEKTAVALRAFRCVDPGSALAFSAGTTCVRIAQMLTRPGGPGGLSVVTNSLPVADEFFRAEQSADRDGTNLPRPTRVLLTGGQRTPSDALVGPLADASLRDLHVDVLFLGAHGAGPAGLSTPNPEEARTNRALIAAAHRVIAVFDSSKWGVTGLSGFADWDAVDAIITGGGLPWPARELLNERVEEVTITS